MFMYNLNSYRVQQILNSKTYTHAGVVSLNGSTNIKDQWGIRAREAHELNKKVAKEEGETLLEKLQSFCVKHPHLYSGWKPKRCQHVCTYEVTSLRWDKSRDSFYVGYEERNSNGELARLVAAIPRLLVDASLKYKLHRTLIVEKELQGSKAHRVSNLRSKIESLQEELLLLETSIIEEPVGLGNVDEDSPEKSKY